jgi:hypothetical protein
MLEPLATGSKNSTCQRKWLTALSATPPLYSSIVTFGFFSWNSARSSELISVRVTWTVLRLTSSRFDKSEVIGDLIPDHKPEHSRESLGKQEAIKELCSQKRHLGGLPGILSVLHTWNRQLG